MRWLRRAVPLTFRGAFLAVLAAAAFAEGILRADLAGLFWGASFLLVPLYFLAAGHLLRIALRRRRSSASTVLAVHLAASGLAPGEEATAHVRAELPRWFAPGLTVRLALPLTWKDRRLDEVQARLAPGRNERDIRFAAVQRGVYRCTEAVLEVGDVLGFTVNRLAVPLCETLTVFPAVCEPRAFPWAAQEGGESPARRRRRRRTEDLLEARKYVPGDDVRKLNWKVFAHMDQLFAAGLPPAAAPRHDSQFPGPGLPGRRVPRQARRVLRLRRIGAPRAAGGPVARGSRPPRVPQLHGGIPGRAPRAPR
jgi:uncharacterized protein (DUF58 family)